ncbi:MAG: glutaredoxin domain-containing protein [Aestuariivirgaceae bacterium]
MKTIEIFTGPRCGYCTAAKALLNQHGLAFTERDISEPAVLQEMRQRLPRAKTIPQIFIDDEHVGGYDDLKLQLG